MKLLLAVVACGVLLFSVVGTTQAQEPVPDLGEQNVLVSACISVSNVADANGITVTNCRRNAPDEIVGNKALLHLKLFTDAGPYEIDVNLIKSLWGITDFVVVR